MVIWNMDRLGGRPHRYPVLRALSGGSPCWRASRRRFSPSAPTYLPTYLKSAESFSGDLDLDLVIVMILEGENWPHVSCFTSQHKGEVFDRQGHDWH